VLSVQHFVRQQCIELHRIHESYN